MEAEFDASSFPIKRSIKFITNCKLWKGFKDFWIITEKCYCDSEMDSVYLNNLDDIWNWSN